MTEKSDIKLKISTKSDLKNLCHTDIFVELGG